MAWQRMVLEFGMGTDIRGGDPTKAAVRALRDALWHNSLTVGELVGQSSDDMRVEVHVGVPGADRVDEAAILAILPHGTGTVKLNEGGLSIPKPGSEDVTLMAHAVAAVYLDVPEGLKP